MTCDTLLILCSIIFSGAYVVRQYFLYKKDIGKINRKYDLEMKRIKAEIKRDEEYINLLHRSIGHSEQLLHILKQYPEAILEVASDSDSDV